MEIKIEIDENKSEILNKLLLEKNISKEDVAKQALYEYLQDYEEAIKILKNPGKIYSMEEVEEMIGEVDR